LNRKVISLFIMLALAALLVAGAGCKGAAQKETITIALTPWSSTIPSTNIAKVLIEDKLGYDVRLQKADVGPTYSGLASGDIDVFVDAWLPDMHGDYMEKYGERIEDLGTVYTEGVMGWVVPAYVEPDSIAELNDFKDKFDTDGNGKGEVVGIEAGAGMMRTSKEIFDAYGLDFELIESSEWAMMAEADKAIKDKRWIIFLGWKPHWMFAKHDLKFLEDPKGIWKSSTVHKLVTKGLDKRAPDVVEFLKKFTVSVDDMDQMIYEIEVQKKDPAEVARAWIGAHSEKVDKMFK